MTHYSNDQLLETMLEAAAEARAARDAAEPGSIPHRRAARKERAFSKAAVELEQASTQDGAGAKRRAGE